ncbi:MAG: hypothetical protein ACI977_000888 [Candidatus Nanohaloarchaea archaeon]|jgi:hypothetical protein
MMCLAIIKFSHTSFLVFLSSEIKIERQMGELKVNVPGELTCIANLEEYDGVWRLDTNLFCVRGTIILGKI